jgi:hypothetical protein
VQLTKQRTPEAVLQQVVKLLQVTEAKGATQAEAAAAASKAQALMFTYNLTTADVSKGERGKVNVTQGSFGMQTDSWRGSHYWQQELLQGVCKYNFAMVLDYNWEYNPKVGRHVVDRVEVIGTPANIQATEYLYAYLYRQIHQLAVRTRRDAWKAAKARHGVGAGQNATENGWTWGELGIPSTVVWERSFGEVGPEAGALVLTLDREVEEAWYERKYGMSKAAYKAQEAKEAKAWEHRRAATKAADDLLEAQYAAGTLKRPRARKERVYRTRPQAWHYDAEDQGREAGRKIAINPGMDGSTDAAVPAPQLGDK